MPLSAAKPQAPCRQQMDFLAVLNRRSDGAAQCRVGSADLAPSPRAVAGGAGGGRGNSRRQKSIIETERNRGGMVPSVTQEGFEASRSWCSCRNRGRE